MSFSRGKDEQWPSPGAFRLLALWKPLRRWCSSCPCLLGWQGDAGSHPRSTARNPGWLCGNVKVELAGTPHPGLCSLGPVWVWVCVCVCVRARARTMGEGLGDGTGESSIFLKEYIQDGVKDISQSITSSSGHLLDFYKDQILLQKRVGGGHS